MTDATVMTPPRSSARLALWLGFLAQNTAVALTFGLYGVFIQSFANTFHLDRTSASAGLPIVILTMGLTNPWMGWLIDRFSIRRLMLAGTCVMSAGFAFASLAPTATLVLACFVLIGLGYALLGTLPATALVANWHDNTRGRAIGFVNIPLGGVLMPPLATALFFEFGWRATFAGFAIALLTLLPLLNLVSDRPTSVPTTQKSPATEAPTSKTTRPSELITSPFFWIVTLAVGIILASGSARSVHIVPYATSVGIDTRHAALLLSLSAFSAIPGAILFGALSDRFSAGVALALNATIQTVGWALLLAVGSHFLALAGAIALLGVCSGGVYVALSTVFSTRYGTRMLGTALGYASALKLPFTFSAPIVIAWLFDLQGNYTFAFGGVLILMLGCAAILTVLVILQMRKQLNHMNSTTGERPG